MKRFHRVLQITTALLTINALSWAMAACQRTPLPAPAGPTTTVNDVAGLTAAISNANASGGNITIFLEDGTYNLSGLLFITADHIAVRSLSGNRDGVMIYGQGMTGGVPHVFLVRGSHFTCADLTLGRVANHGIQVQGEQDADFTTVHNVRFVDTMEQMLKVSGSSTSAGSDFGLVEWCLFEYTAGIGPQFYIGGIDAHHALNWTVRHNIFKYIRSPDGSLAEHAIHFWSFSEQTNVHHNQIIDCDRGIGFGLGSSGHIGGRIVNNMVYVTRDVGIGLETANNVTVAHNTVYTLNYFNSIEYRFAATTGGIIKNNVTNEAIASRNGGTADVDNNVTSAQASWFVDPTGGDLHLNATRIEVVDTGLVLTGVDTDFDCQDRPIDLAPDIGADEYLEIMLLGDLNGSGQVNVVDLLIQDYHLAGDCPQGTAPFTAPLTMADIDQNTFVEQADLTMLARFLAGLTP